MLIFFFKFRFEMFFGFFITVIKCQNIKNPHLPVADSKNIFFKCSIPKFILRWSKNLIPLFEL